MLTITFMQPEIIIRLYEFFYSSYYTKYFKYELYIDKFSCDKDYTIYII